MSWSWRVALAAALAMVPASASASPLRDTLLDGAMFMGPAHPHATAIYVNPAAMGLASQGTHFYLGGRLRLDHLSIERTRLTDPDAQPTPTPEVSAMTLAPGGTLAIYNVGSTASLGVAIGLPMYQAFIEDEPSLGYHTLGGHHRQIAWVSFGTSFRVNERLSFGTGLSLTTTSFHFSFLRDTALELGTPGTTADCGGAPCGIEHPDAAERYDVSVGSSGLLGTQNLAIQAGVVYQVAQDWWLAVSYQSPPGLQAPLSLGGEVEVTPAPRDQAAGQAPFTAKAEVIYLLPQVISVAVRGPVTPSFELVASARWQNLSRQRLLDLRIYGRDVAPGTPEWYPRFVGLRDVVGLEVGLEGKPSRRPRAGVRLRYDSGATSPEALSPMFVDRMSLGLTLGGELPLWEGLVLSASYGLTWYPSTTATQSLYDPRDRITCVDAQFEIDACIPAAEGRAIPSAAGTYSRLSQAARLSIRYSFL